jgi:hypothetical protein
MYGFKVYVNQMEIVRVSIKELDVFSIRVSGDLKSQEIARLDINGGKYPKSKESIFLIWIDSKELHYNDLVEVEFCNIDLTSFRGKTIDELYEDEEDFNSSEETLEERFKALAGLPNLRNKMDFEVISPSGEEYCVATNRDDYCFGHTVLWNSKHREKASVFLTSNSIDKVKNRENGSEHVRFNIKQGERTSLRLTKSCS